VRDKCVVYGDVMDLVAVKKRNMKTVIKRLEKVVVLAFQ
jgi:hypothetical protein